MIVVLALLIGLAAPPSPCVPQREALERRAAAAKSSAELWKIEAERLTLDAHPGCAVEGAEKAPKLPSQSVISVPVELPERPTGAGAGPWVVLGLSAALAGGVIWLDSEANGTRDEIEAAQVTGDRDAYDTARDELETKQLIARGVATGAVIGVVIGVTWLLVGGEDDPVQHRPIFTGQGGGVEVRF